MYFVTGASGFIGIRLVNALEAQAASIRILSRNKMAGLDTVICDLHSESIPGDAMEGVNTVFHLAGFAHDMHNSSKDQHLYQAINVDATVRLAKLAIISGVKQFIFLSSVKAGGMTFRGKCMKETDQSEPEGIYAESKRKAELKLLEIGHQSGMHVSIVRSSLVYGPDVKGNLSMMLSAIKKGWFPPLPEVGNRRSLVHVDDLVRAMILVAEDDRTNGEIFIVTDGEPHSSREVYEAMCCVLGKTIPRWSVPKFLFKLIAYVSLHNRYKIDKILGDECYSSNKINSIGFKAQQSLKEMNETVF